MTFTFKSEADKWLVISALTMAAETHETVAGISHFDDELRRCYADQAKAARRIAAEIEAAG